MSKTFLEGRVVLHDGDCREVLRELPDNSVDSVVTDPPYFLESISKRFGAEDASQCKPGRDGSFKRLSGGFMGKAWDASESVDLDVGLGNWLAGFADGEGCFVSRKINSEGGGYCCEFIIHIRADDSSILKYVHTATGIGTIRFQDRRDGGNQMVKWVVSKKLDCMKLVQIFRAFPLRAKKKNDFEIWAKAVDEWVRHEPGDSWDSVIFHAEMLSHVKKFGASPNSVQFFHYRWAKEVFRVLKPGGHIVSFAGTRSYHRLASAIEDAGFEIRDLLAWIFGSGFPKSRSMAQIGRPELGTSLKPAHEPICLARKPLSEPTIAANVLRWGTGALNIGACRIKSQPRTTHARGNISGKRGEIYGNGYGLPPHSREAASSRWPANLCHDGSEEVLAGFPETTSGDVKPYKRKHGDASFKGEFLGGTIPYSTFERNSDSGSSARYFYTAKADGDDRLGSKHPTVKPIDLIQWLCRLVTPPRGTTLDMFAGTGTTGEAAYREGFNAILIEREAEYHADIERRMSLILDGKTTRKHASVKARGREADAGPLFGCEPQPYKSTRTIGPVGMNKSEEARRRAIDEAAE